VFESIGRPKYTQPGGKTAPPIAARAAMSTEPARRRSFWDCLFGPPDYTHPGNQTPSPGHLETRSLTIDVRCPKVNDDEISLGNEVLAALPSGASNVKIWSSGTRSVTPNAFVGAFVVGVTPGGIALVPGQITFRPLWVRMVNDVIEAGSLEATLLVTFEI